MRLEITINAAAGPVVRTADVAGPTEALRVARSILFEELSDWTPEQEATLRSALRDAASRGTHTSRSLVITLTP